MIKQLFQKEQNCETVTLDKNNDLIVMYPDGDKSVYFYQKNYINNSVSLLVEWNGNKWNVDAHNKDSANMFFYYMKLYPHVYKNFIKKIITNKNQPKISK
jgi:hypothetical protein